MADRGLDDLRAGAAPERAPCVLVVDDNRMVLLSTRLVLETAGFRVVVSDSGERTLADAVRERPDVIVLDLMMPGTDGWETLRLLRAEPRTADTPVILFSARELHHGRTKAREHGAVEFVQKPFDAGALVALVKRHAASRSAVRTPAASEPVPTP